jgi:hypothetical protein
VLTAAGASLLVLLLVVLAPVIRAGRRMLLRRRPRPSPQPGTHWLPLTTQVAAGLWVVLLTAIAIICIVVGGPDAMPPTSAWDKYFVLINIITAVALGFSLAAVFSAIRIWRHTTLRKISMLKYSVVALACAFLSWFSLHWHLLGPVRI